MLWGLIALSVLLSLVAGPASAALGGRVGRTAHAVACGGVLLALGLVFEIAAWSSAPVWHHLVFLALLVPACAAGGAAIARARIA